MRKKTKIIGSLLALSSVFALTACNIEIDGTASGSENIIPSDTSIPSVDVTPTPSVEPTVTPTPDLTDTPTPTPTPTPTVTPTPTPTPTPTVTPTPTPTPTPNETVTPSPSTPSTSDTSSDTNTGTISNLSVLNCKGYQEGAYIEVEKITGLNSSDYAVSYKKSSDSAYTKIDNELIRVGESSVRADILGLASGTYSIKVEANGETQTVEQIAVEKYDRSGYAHFNASTGVGAYNNDGTIKDNAVIVYVSEETKNTVKATIGGDEYTGICNIIAAQSNSDNPLIVRIVGTIGAATWKSITYSGNAVSSTSVTGLNGSVLPQESLSEDDIIDGGYNQLDESKYSKLNGLTNKIKYSSGEFDSYYNMLDIKNAENVTIEGVGPNAMIYQWGFTWKNCTNIEVRNLTFDDYTEDACSFEGSETSVSSLSSFKTGNIWVHHNTFNEGINYWDVCYEQDKHEGDGATDFKGLKNITISYNHYYKNHKTGLVGGSDSNSTANITFHHNFYDQCSSRLPLGRRANMHMYNNYYYKSSGTNMSLRAGAYAFIENCVFEGCNNPMEVKTHDTYGNAAAKVYNSSFINCEGTNGGTVVTNRTDTVVNANVFAPSFDTNTSTFYYDATNQKSNVAVMTELENVAEFVKQYAGANADSFYLDDTNTNTGTGGSTTTPEEDTTEWTTVLTDDFSTTKTITELTAAPTESGLYYYYTEGGDSTNNNVNIADGKLNIIDTSTYTTFGYYMFDQKYNSGKVKISLDFLPQTSNSKWTMVHFLDGNTNIGVRTDGNKVFNYTTDGASTLYPITSSALVANTTYTITLTIDFDNNTATIDINGSTVNITNYECNEINGIMFQTADSSSRSFAIDNLKVETA